MKKMILLFILFKSTVLYAQLKVNHEIAENYSSGEVPFEYIIANNVPLRVNPDKAARAIAFLKIGQGIKLLERKDSLLINGVQSAWYKTNFNGKTGWVWGGSIAESAFGSNEDPEVKFLAGFSHKKDEGPNIRNYIQLRAVKNQKEIAKLVFPSSASQFQLASNLGKKGLSNVADVLSVMIPCIGGCGCSGGEHIIVWDGQKFHQMILLWGTADADFSEGNSIIFPSDMAGEKGFIKIFEDLLDYSYDYNRNNILRRIQTTTFYRWTGEKLMKADERKPVRKVIYYDFENHKIVPEPALTTEEN